MNKKPLKHQIFLIEGTTDGPIKFCYHLEELYKKKTFDVVVKRPFRIVCNICKQNVNKELASKEIIFELDKMTDWGVKYAMMAKGMQKVSEIMLQKKIARLWDDPFLIEFMRLFETKDPTNEVMYEDLLWAIKYFQFDEELYKYSILSPEFEMQFHPQRNINQIDVRFIMERLVHVFNIYHKIVHPEYKLKDGEQPLTIPTDITTAKGLYMEDDPEEEHEPIPEPVIIQKEEKTYMHIPYKRKTRLEIEYEAPHSILRRAEAINIKDIVDLSEFQFQMEYDALKIIYIDSILMDKDITHAIAEKNMEDVGSRMPIQKALIKAFGQSGPLLLSFSKRIFFVFEVDNVMSYILVYPDSGSKLKEWVNHSLQLYTTGLQFNDKALIEKTNAFREKFLLGVHRVLRDFIPSSVLLIPGQSIFPKKPRYHKEHFVTLADEIHPKKLSRKVCLAMIKRPLENWDNFDIVRSFTITRDDLVLPKDIIPKKKLNESEDQTPSGKVGSQNSRLNALTTKDMFSLDDKNWSKYYK